MSKSDRISLEDLGKLEPTSVTPWLDLPPDRIAIAEQLRRHNSSHLQSESEPIRTLREILEIVDRSTPRNDDEGRRFSDIRETCRRIIQIVEKPQTAKGDEKAVLYARLTTLLHRTGLIAVKAAPVAPQPPLTIFVVGQMGGEFGYLEFTI